MTGIATSPRIAGDDAPAALLAALLIIGGACLVGFAQLVTEDGAAHTSPAAAAPPPAAAAPPLAAAGPLDLAPAPALASVAVAQPPSASPPTSPNSPPPSSPPVGAAAPAIAAPACVPIEFQFRSGSARLDRVARQRVGGLATWLIAHADGTVDVVGHSSPGGHDAQNVRLSYQRASAVGEALVVAGVAAERVVAQGFAATRQRADLPATAAAQRRVSVVVRGPTCPSADPGATSW